MQPENLVTQVQLALIGVILVVGLFFIWRTICRIEEKVDALKMNCSAAAQCPFKPGGAPTAMMSEEEAMKTAEQLMNDVFNSAAPYVVYSEDVQVEDDIPEHPNVEEIPEHTPPPPPNPPETPEPSESETDQNPLSKTKLKKMNVDELKELCRQRGLSPDGSKNVLVDRVLGVAH